MKLDDLAVINWNEMSVNVSFNLTIEDMPKPHHPTSDRHLVEELQDLMSNTWY